MVRHWRRQYFPATYWASESSIIDFGVLKGPRRCPTADPSNVTKGAEAGLKRGFELTIHLAPRCKISRKGLLLFEDLA